MPKNDTGEFELVLGNRQLLSGFAVVAILFGVFFAMGYIVGRNSTPASRLTVEAHSLPPETARAESSLSAAPLAESTGSLAGAAAGPPEEPRESTAPVRAPEAPRTKEKRADPPAPVQMVETVKPGTYLQVMAIKKQDADVIAKALQGKGFPTLMTPSSIEGIFRVMVGPYRDSTSLGNAKTELENSGFHPIVQRIAEKS